MRRNPGPSLISATSSQHRNATTGRPMRTTRSSSSLVVVFVRPTRIVRHGRGGRADLPDRSARVVVGQILATQRGHFRPPAAAGGERRQKQCPIAQIDGLFSRAGLQKLCQHIARHRLFALSLPRSGAGADRKPQRRFERRPIEGACQASPTGQDQPVAAPDGLGGMRTFCPKQAARPPPACHGLDLPCV